MSTSRELGRTVGRYFSARKVNNQKRRAAEYARELLELETKRLELAKAEIELQRAHLEMSVKLSNKSDPET